MIDAETLKDNFLEQEEGFTLIEIVISVAIISIALVTLLTILNRTIVASGDSSILTRGVMLAEEKLTVAEVEGELAAGVSEWETDKRYPRFRYRKTVEPTPLEGVVQVKMEVMYDKKAVVSMENFAR
ncbi:MAG: prepilin-type N-terminal cleavage/methylation domain-containing protein [Nitrospinota bacterium]|nr:prepilin-type N-terminal cleavage/methylation domain-containing protein [Nitrospinota bacterium]